MDGIIRKAVRLGADPVTAIQMATLHPARYFGLRENGAVAPGYRRSGGFRGSGADKSSAGL